LLLSDPTDTKLQKMMKRDNRALVQLLLDCVAVIQNDVFDPMLVEAFQSLNEYIEHHGEDPPPRRPKKADKKTRNKSDQDLPPSRRDLPPLPLTSPVRPARLTTSTQSDESSTKRRGISKSPRVEQDESSRRGSKTKELDGPSPAMVRKGRKTNDPDESDHRPSPRREVKIRDDSKHGAPRRQGHAVDESASRREAKELEEKKAQRRRLSEAMEAQTLTAQGLAFTDQLLASEQSTEKLLEEKRRKAQEEEARKQALREEAKRKELAEENKRAEKQRQLQEEQLRKEQQQAEERNRAEQARQMQEEQRRHDEERKRAQQEAEERLAEWQAEQQLLEDERKAELAEQHRLAAADQQRNEEEERIRVAKETELLQMERERMKGHEIAEQRRRAEVEAELERVAQLEAERTRLEEEEKRAAEVAENIRLETLERAFEEYKLQAEQAHTQRSDGRPTTPLQVSGQTPPLQSPFSQSPHPLQYPIAQQPMYQPPRPPQHPSQSPAYPGQQWSQTQPPLSQGYPRHPSPQMQAPLPQQQWQHSVPHQRHTQAPPQQQALQAGTPQHGYPPQHNGVPLQQWQQRVAQQPTQPQWTPQQQQQYYQQQQQQQQAYQSQPQHHPQLFQRAQHPPQQQFQPQQQIYSAQPPQYPKQFPQHNAQIPRSPVANGHPYHNAQMPQSPVAPAVPPQASIASKYTAMADQNGDVDPAIKRNILVHWGLQPPAMQTLRPIQGLMTAIHNIFPPAFGVAPHDYFAKWKAVSVQDVASDDGVKKAVKKLRFFLHPDKLPKDLDNDQSFVCKILWDISNDAFHEFEKMHDELDWIGK
jgi:hypothetical protein